MKRLLLFILLVLSSSFSFALMQSESVGGTATSLGGIILDRDLGGLNAIYNPSQIVLNGGDSMALDISATGAANPYGITGINNAAIGATLYKPGDSINLGFGLAAHMSMVSGGINQTRLFLSGAASLDSLINNSSVISGLGGSVTFKVIQFGLGGVAVESISSTSAISVGMDADVTIKLFKNKVSLGVTGADLLPVPISFNGTSNIPDQMGLFIHAKFALSDSLAFYGAFNPLGQKHLVERDNFFSSSIAMMNMYYGLEANFANALFVRIGVKDGRLTGGIGINVDDLTVNVGVMPINALGLYYQADISYKLDFGAKKSKVKVNSEVETKILETESVEIE